jgi:hypothetical protein
VALFGLVGYVVQTAQEELLGLPSAGFDSRTFFTAAADFLRDTLGFSIGFVQPSRYTQLSFEGHAAAWLWAMTVAALLSVTGLWLLTSRFRTDRPWLRRSVNVLPIFVMIAVIGSKFVLLDLPVSHLRSTILGNDQTSIINNGETSPARDDFALRGKMFVNRILGSEAQGANVAETPHLSGTATRTLRLWRNLVCSRIGRTTEFRSGLPEEAQGKCQIDRRKARAKLDTFYLSELWCAGILALIIGSLLLLRSASGGSVAISLVAAFSLLSVPYSYGKLMRSTYFDYGLIALNKPLLGSYGLAQGAPLFGLLVEKNASNTTLLVIEHGSCDPGAPEFRLVKEVSVSNTDLISVEEIYRQDVLTWALEQQSPCHRCPPGDLSCSTT